MAFGSKQKGNSFERWVANYLSLRFKDRLGVEHGFVRKPDSGAYFGGQNRSRTHTHLADMQSFGDILAPDEFRWSVECKAYKQPVTLSALVEQRCAQFDDWYEQATKDSESAGKQPMLVVKYNNVKPFVMVRADDLRDMAVTPVMVGEAVFKYKGWLAYPLDLFFREADEAYFG